MATKMTISYICDGCGYEDEDKNALYHYVVEVPQVSIKKAPKRMEMDLCVDCSESLESMYVDIWRPEVRSGLTSFNKTTGYVPPAITDGDRPTVCDVCGFQAKSWNGLLVHKKRKGHENG